MLTTILEQVGPGFAAAGQWIVNLFNSIIAIFWTAGDFTFFGAVFVIIIGIVLVITFINLILNLLGLGVDDDD